MAKSAGSLPQKKRAGDLEKKAQAHDLAPKTLPYLDLLRSQPT